MLRQLTCRHQEDLRISQLFLCGPLMWILQSGQLTRTKIGGLVPGLKYREFHIRIDQDLPHEVSKEPRRGLTRQGRLLPPIAQHRTIVRSFLVMPCQ